MAWRELVRAQHSPTELLNDADDMAAQQAGAEADLREAYESHTDAQMMVWNTLTEFLGSRGRLMHIQPDIGSPCFSTGWMALEQHEINARGETLPILALQVETSEHHLIQGYFRKQAEHPGLRRRLFPPSPDELHQERTEMVRKYIPASSLGYIQLQTALVSWAGSREPEAPWSTHGGIRGAYVPSILMKTKDRRSILPSDIPLNTNHNYNRTSKTGFMRVEAPKRPEISLVSYDSGYETPTEYVARLKEDIVWALEKRDTQIRNLGEIVNILQTAAQIDFSVYDHFEDHFERLKSHE